MALPQASHFRVCQASVTHPTGLEGDAEKGQTSTDHKDEGPGAGMPPAGMPAVPRYAMQEWDTLRRLIHRGREGYKEPNWTQNDCALFLLLSSSLYGLE